jgi:hypothetical protein
MTDAPQVPAIHDSFAVVGLVGDLVDNMSSCSPGQDMFYVDTRWALDLIEAVTGERSDPDPDPLGFEPPDYPCPDDPDGLHHAGCGCEHYGDDADARYDAVDLPPSAELGQSPG